MNTVNVSPFTATPHV